MLLFLLKYFYHWSQVWVHINILLPNIFLIQPNKWVVDIFYDYNQLLWVTLLKKYQQQPIMVILKKLVDEPTRVMYVGVKMKKKKKVNKTWWFISRTRMDNYFHRWPKIHLQIAISVENRRIQRNQLNKCSQLIRDNKQLDIEVNNPLVNDI